MHQQVGIPTDGRREVGVGLVGETEVADVVGAVHRLTQRTQHHGLQQLAVRTVADLRQQCGVVLRVRLVATAELEAEFAEEGAQFLQTVLARAFVHAIQRRLLAVLEKA